MSDKSFHITPIVLPISHSIASGFLALTESHTFLEYLWYGRRGLSGAFGGFGTPLGPYKLNMEYFIPISERQLRVITHHRFWGDPLRVEGVVGVLALHEWTGAKVIMLHGAALLLEHKPLLLSVEEGSRIQRLLRLVATSRRVKERRKAAAC